MADILAGWYNQSLLDDLERESSSTWSQIPIALVFYLWGWETEVRANFDNFTSSEESNVICAQLCDVTDVNAIFCYMPYYYYLINYIGKVHTIYIYDYLHINIIPFIYWMR